MFHRSLAIRVGLLATSAVFPQVLTVESIRAHSVGGNFFSPKSSQQQQVDVRSLEQHADIYMLRRRYGEALESYQQLVKLQPKNPVFHNKLGMAYHHLQDSRSARKSYRRAIKLNPRYAQAINNLAAAEHAQENYKSAIFSYLRALELAPRNAVIYSNLGRAYLARENFDYALESFRHALSLDPEVFRSGGRFGAIVQQRDDRNSPAFNFYMAKSYASAGNAEQALQHLRNALDEGFPDMLKALQGEVFEFLASDPQFQVLLADAEALERDLRKAGGSQRASRPIR